MNQDFEAPERQRPLRGTCVCGRPLFPRHCPACGSTNLYSRRKNEVIYIGDDGRKYVSPGLHCRRCTLDFNTLMECEVPVFEDQSMEVKRQKDLAAEKVRAAFENAVQGITDPVEQRKKQVELAAKLAQEHMKKLREISE